MPSRRIEKRSSNWARGIAARTCAAAASCSFASFARYAWELALWTSRCCARDAEESERSELHAASGGAARRTITRVQPRCVAAGMWSTPARTRGSAASRASRRIGVSAADAEDAATSPITAISIKGRRKVPHLSRSAVKVAPVFEGKNALILGVANKRSIAWAIAKRLADGGATVAFTFQGERIEKNVRELAAVSYTHLT